MECGRVKLPRGLSKNRGVTWPSLHTRPFWRLLKWKNRQLTHSWLPWTLYNYWDRSQSEIYLHFLYSHHYHSCLGPSCTASRWGQQELAYHHWIRYQGGRMLSCILLYQSAGKTKATSGYRHQGGGRAAVEYQRPPAPHHLGKLN